MTPKCVRKFFKSSYIFSRETGMSSSSFMNWEKTGYIPYLSQKKIEKVTQGKLKARWVDPEDYKQKDITTGV